MKTRTARPRNMLAGRYGYGLAQIRRNGKSLSPTTVNLGILGGGLLLGLITYQYKDSPLGATLLGAAGSVSAVALVFFVRELLLGEGRHCPTVV